MFFRSRSSTNEQDPQTRELLQNLLLTPPLENSRPLRRIALRSRDEQRQIALRSFLQRTWLDNLLHHTEQVLVLAVVAAFVYWIGDGYGRDWLHTLEQPHAQAAAKEHIAATAVPTHVPTPVRHVSEAAKSLPFTTPAMAQPPEEPDALAPRAMAAVAPPSDQRPQRLIAPTIGLDTPVVEVFVQDGVWQVADYAAGFNHGTALPGAVGNTVMAGHAGFRGGVFGNLGGLAPGDDIFVVAGGWQYHYRARATTSVWPNQIEVMDPTSTPVLTLITCTAWDTQRLVVVADLVGSLPESN